MNAQFKYHELVLRIVAIGLVVAGCALSVSPTNSKDREIVLELAAFPNRISAEDSTAALEIWATIKRGDKAIDDSTLVVFATTAGTITTASLTRDGLAIAILTSPGNGRPQEAQIIAQALTVRDTIEVTFLLLE
jgi:hypothetical protein